MKKILIVEDDVNLSKVLTMIMQDEGYLVTACANYHDSSVQLSVETFDLALLDIELPDGNGFDLYEKIIAPKSIPVVFLSSRSTESERIYGLKLGADDYVTKPFSTQELLLRIARSLKRHQSPSYLQNMPSFPSKVDAGISLNESAYEVTYQGTKIDFTATEVQIVSLFMKNPRRVCTREFLMDSLPGDRLDTADRSIDAHIKRIRRKFRDVGVEPIQTIRGVGYKYEVS